MFTLALPAKGTNRSSWAIGVKLPPLGGGITPIVSAVTSMANRRKCKHLSQGKMTSMLTSKERPSVNAPIDAL